MSNHNDTQPNQRRSTGISGPQKHPHPSQRMARQTGCRTTQPARPGRFKQWVNADPAHRIAFEELVEFWDEMNILTQAVLPESYDP